MSSPRAATSVATSSGSRPSLKEIITPSRAPWVMSPWSARTSIPRSRRRRYSCIGADLGPDEHDRLGGPLRLEHLDQLVDLLARLDLERELLDRVDGEGCRLDLDRHRVVHVLLRQPADRRRHRRAEQRRLPARRSQRHDPLDVLEESEVEHLVGLVEHDEAAGVEHQRVARDKVLDAPDRADHDLAAGAQLGLLGADRRAAEDGHHVDALAVAVRAQRLGDLDAQLAGRREHEPLDLGLARVDVLEHRQPERRGLARSRSAPGRSRPCPRAAAGSPAPGSGWAARSRRRGSPRGSRAPSPRSENDCSPAAKIACRRI